QHDPQRQRAFALGFAHEVAVGAGEQFPVDLAQVVAGFVAAVLRKLQATAALLAGMLAVAMACGTQPHLQPQWPQACQHLRWYRDHARFPQGAGCWRKTCAITSSVLIRSASAAN